MNRKKVYLVIHSLVGGGAERVFVNLCNNINKKKFDVELVLFEKEGEYLNLINSDIKIHTLEHSGYFRTLFKLHKIIWKNRPDIVLSTLPHINSMMSVLILFLPKRKIKFIARETTILKQYKLHPIFLYPYKIFCNNFNLFIAQSNDMKEAIDETLKVKPEKIKVIHNPINFEFIYKNIQAKEIFNFSKDKVNLITVGSFTYKKGYDLLITTFSKLKNRKNFHLYILGKGDLEKELKEQVSKLKINEDITFLGFKENPYVYLSKSDIFISSSRFEGFPNAVLEAMACGIPVISNNYKGGIHEIISPEYKNGVVIDILDEESLREGIKYCLNLNKEDIQSSVYSRFKLLDIIKKYEFVFENDNLKL